MKESTQAIQDMSDIRNTFEAQDEAQNVDKNEADYEEYLKVRKSDISIKECYSLIGRDYYDIKPAANGKFSCTDCNYGSKWRTDLAKHFLNNHVDIKLQCDECPKEFNSFNALQYHKRAVHEGIYFSCDICPNKGTTKSNLRRHIMKYH